MVHDQKKLKEMLAIVPFSAELNSGLPNTWMHHPCAREITIKIIYQKLSVHNKGVNKKSPTLKF